MRRIRLVLTFVQSHHHHIKATNRPCFFSHAITMDMISIDSFGYVSKWVYMLLFLADNMSMDEYYNLLALYFTHTSCDDFNESAINYFFSSSLSRKLNPPPSHLLPSLTELQTFTEVQLTQEAFYGGGRTLTRKFTAILWLFSIEFGRIFSVIGKWIEYIYIEYFIRDKCKESQKSLNEFFCECVDCCRCCRCRCCCC